MCENGVPVKEHARNRPEELVWRRSHVGETCEPCPPLPLRLQPTGLCYREVSAPWIRYQGASLSEEMSGEASGKLRWVVTWGLHFKFWHHWLVHTLICDRRQGGRCRSRVTAGDQQGPLGKHT